MAKVIRRVVETAAELHFTPEHAEIVRLGDQSQVGLTKIDSRIKPGQRVNLYTKSAEIKVVSIERRLYVTLPWPNLSSLIASMLLQTLSNLDSRVIVYSPRLPSSKHYLVVYYGAVSCFYRLGHVILWE
jgi:hypothetical protein